METDFWFKDDLKPNPMFDGWDSLDLAKRGDMSIRDTPNIKDSDDEDTILVD